MVHCPVVIVGAGPAGMAAAITATEAGLRPTVIDEHSQPGGQIYHQPHAAWRLASGARPDSSGRRGAALLRRFHQFQDRMEFLANGLVWGLFPPCSLAVSRGRGWDLVAADSSSHRAPAFPAGHGSYADAGQVGALTVTLIRKTEHPDLPLPH